MRLPGSDLERLAAVTLAQRTPYFHCSIPEIHGQSAFAPCRRANLVGIVLADEIGAMQTPAVAKKKPAYCALISLTPPALMILNPSCSPNRSGFRLALIVVRREKSVATTSTTAPKLRELFLEAV
jgi:hypothetical protein